MMLNNPDRRVWCQEVAWSSYAAHAAAPAPSTGGAAAPGPQERRHGGVPRRAGMRLGPYPVPTTYETGDG